ncbi:MAG: cation transporter [Burkholderiales bacterium]|nr:MAG: cation transporter [Burkholderiales bacterium]
MAWLSIGTSLATLALKFGAWALTDSVSLLSDAIEALVNLAAGLVALGAVTIAARPADDRHAYGHDKAEYFSSGVEGALILVAALGIVWAALHRLAAPQPLQHLGVGLAVALLAAGANLFTARTMLQAARQHDSITLEADARHLLTDVWTSVVVVAGLAVVWAMPAWSVLDPLLAIAVAVHILWTGLALLRRSIDGLMDAALPEAETQRAQAIIAAQLAPDATFHALRSRKSGARRFLDFHLLVPGHTTVDEAHRLCDRIEQALRAELAQASITIHVEPRENHQAHPGDREL